MKIPFVGPAYQARSINASAERAVNCYLEQNPNPSIPAVLYGRPGYSSVLTFPVTPIRGTIELASYSIWVVSNRVYRVDTGYGMSLLGTIGTSEGAVGLASNGTEVLIVDGASGWLATESALTQITDVDFPSGVTRATYIGTYFVVTGDGTGKFYWSENPDDGSAWNGLDFSSAEGSPDECVGCLANQLELVLFGGATIEIWVLTGDADSPFQRSGNTFIQVGTQAALSFAPMDNTFFWLGEDNNGTGMVFKANGYTPVRISTHAVEKAIQSYSTISDAFAMTMQMEGHSFYVLTFPTANATWVYDVATSLWFEWSWRDPADNTDHRWRPVCHSHYNGVHLVGDFETGDVYQLDFEENEDDGDPIRFLRATQVIDSHDGERLFYESIEVFMETGVGDISGSDPQLMLRYSNDGGHTWSNYKTKSIGQIGEYGKRVKYGPTGSGRNRVWEISITDNVKRAILGASVRASRGTS